jgi:hypothetical protein
MLVMAELCAAYALQLSQNVRDIVFDLAIEYDSLVGSAFNGFHDEVP